MMEWITDRQPTKEDEYEGEVVMQCFPGGRRSSNGMVNALVAAAHVGPGVPWRHTIYWKPSATREPEPEAPKPAPKPELRVGQVWRTGSGGVVVIESEDPGCDYPFRGSNGECFTPNGRYSAQQESVHDLFELITNTPAEEPEPKPTPTTRKVPRGFSAFYDMPKNLNGGPKRIFIAIATDGTAWSREPDDCGGGWTQFEPLPDREEPINA